jgi:hypothetical protein
VFYYLYCSRTQINIVDVDSKELITSWILNTNGTAPNAVRSYDVQLKAGEAVLKKIVFKNPWNVPRRFTVRGLRPSPIWLM